MPLRVKDKILSNQEVVGRMSMRELNAYRKALEDFMCSNSPMIAMTLKQVYQEIEWRKSSASHSRT
jgi:hypothetical protein